MITSTPIPLPTPIYRVVFELPSDNKLELLSLLKLAFGVAIENKIMKEIKL